MASKSGYTAKRVMVSSATLTGMVIDLLPGGTLTDIEGNVYRTVQIGTRLWMAENLRVTKYNDGTPIPHLPDDGQWTSCVNTSAPGYCWYNNDPKNGTGYGAMYNFFAVATGKLAPTGWHVSTDQDWAALGNYYGGDSKAATKVKDTLLWATPNVTTNESGLSLRGGGFRRYNNAIFAGQTFHGDYWSPNGKEPWGRVVSHLSDSINRYIYTGPGVEFRQQMGFSVRCVKNK